MTSHLMKFAAGSSVHIVACKRVSLKVDMKRKGCYNEIPMHPVDPDNPQKLLNKTLWVDPVTKIIVPTPVPQLCDRNFPKQFHLDGGVFLQSIGDGMVTSPPPDLIQVDITSPLATGLSKPFHDLMGEVPLTRRHNNDM